MPWGCREEDTAASVLCPSPTTTALERAPNDLTSFQKQLLGILPFPSLSVLRLKLCPPTTLTSQ